MALNYVAAVLITTLEVKNSYSCVSANMLKKIWLVGWRNFFFPEKNSVGPVIL